MAISSTLQQRRKKLTQLLDTPIILWSGGLLSRNFPANCFPFRASSHFLYFTALNLPHTAIHLAQGELTLFYDNPPPNSALWHGEMPTREVIAENMGAEQAYPWAELTNFVSPQTATIPVQDYRTSQQQSQILQRSLPASDRLRGNDLKLAQAIVQLRLQHDKESLKEIREAIQVSILAHQAGIKASIKAQTEAEVRSAIEQVIIKANMTNAYPSIVTSHGEILHNESYSNPIKVGDLILADVGAETRGGWAADITRTFPVGGKFSPSQQAIYQIVLAAHDRCIAAMQPGVEYQDIHLLAARTIAEGLVDLGILKGNSADLVEMDAHALFFPHGIGHLLGLDVHDMEDLGDIAGYATGRSRSNRFGLGYLRLNRPLMSGMVVTIEPGFYQVPAILNNPELRYKFKNVVNWQRLADFADVRGIRIEDDVLITSTGVEVLSAALPTKIPDIEQR